MEHTLISSIFPAELLQHFDITDVQLLGNLRIQKDCFYVSLDEKNILPEGYDSADYESKGFYEMTIVQDFPIRGKAVYLLVRRRRWRSKINSKLEIKSAYSFITEGSKLTAELSDFLKGRGRESSGYD